MSLRAILSITHGLVVVLFLCVFLTVFFSLAKPPDPPGSPGQARALASLLDSGASQEVLRLRLAEMRFRDATLDLFDAQGRRRHILGAWTPLEFPAFGGAVATGRVFVELGSPQRQFVQWMPLRLRDGQTYVLRVANKRSAFPSFSLVVRNVTISLAIALGTCLLVAWAMARMIAQPVRRLAQLTERFGREGLALRASADGPRELADLAGSFNRMATYLQSTIEELQEQKEEALQAERSRRQFLADVSHNLRTPLAAMLGWNDTLLEGLSPGEDPTLYLQRLRREIMHVTRIVARLLELSRWEKAGPTLRQESVPLADLLLEVAENLEDAAHEAGVKLSFEGLGPRVAIHADRQKARDIFQILLENVVAHAGPRTHATVSIIAESARVLFTVSDNGVGFPAGMLSNSEVARGGDEHGRVCLGLTIATRLVAAHGSELKLANSPEGGARVSFWLPRSEEASVE